MKFGAVSSIDSVEFMAEAGFNYIELVVDQTISPNIPNEEWKRNLKKIKQLPLPASTACGLIPPSLMLVGPDTDMKRNLSYADKLLARAEEAEISTLVFGSNKVRNIPEGFDPAVAAGQLAEFLEAMTDHAAPHGIDIVLEPLHSGCTNTFTTLASCASMVRKLNRKNFRLLVDFFHFCKTDNDIPSLYWNTDLLRHVHVSTKGRQPPGAEPCDFSWFMKILKASGYDRTMSIEALSFTRETAGPALETLQRTWNDA